MTTAKKPGNGASSGDEQAGSFSADERAAMKERAQELKQERRRGRASRADQERAVLEKIAELPDPDRALAERLHVLITTTAPDLVPRTWYGMPAYAKDGKVLCFFQGAAKFKERYSTLGFSGEANLADGAMWPTSFALTKMTDEVEARIVDLVRRATS